MSAADPVNDCCGVMVTPGARFCVKCGRKLTLDEQARAVIYPPRPPLLETINCSGCGVALPLKDLIEPLYEMLRETPEDIEAGARRPSKATLAREAGKLLLPNVEALETQLRARVPLLPDFMREANWQAELNDPVIAAFDQVTRIARLLGLPRGGHTAPSLVVLDCRNCGQKDPAGLYRDVEAARAKLPSRRTE